MFSSLSVYVYWDNESWFGLFGYLIEAAVTNTRSLLNYDQIPIQKSASIY